MSRSNDQQTERKKERKLRILKKKQRKKERKMRI